MIVAVDEIFVNLSYWSWYDLENGFDTMVLVVFYGEPEDNLDWIGWDVSTGSWQTALQFWGWDGQSNGWENFNFNLL